jgi:hypothetical protein
MRSLVHSLVHRLQSTSVIDCQEMSTSIVMKMLNQTWHILNKLTDDQGQILYKKIRLAYFID